MFEAKKRRVYTKEFKQDALNLSKQPGYTAFTAAFAQNQQRVRAI
jgi:transposase-like protein